MHGHPCGAEFFWESMKVLSIFPIIHCLQKWPQILFVYKNDLRYCLVSTPHCPGQTEVDFKWVGPEEYFDKFLSVPLTFLVLKAEYSGITRSLSQMLMPWKGNISTTCTTSVLRNGRTWKYILFSLPALLQLHLHYQLNTQFQWIWQR